MSRPEQLLAKISDRTRQMWYELNKKDGCVKYQLCVNGLGEVELLRRNLEVVAKGNGNIQKFIREQLKK